MRNGVVASKGSPINFHPFPARPGRNAVRPRRIQTLANANGHAELRNYLVMSATT
jgi:hypothetical protein